MLNALQKKWHKWRAWRLWQSGLRNLSNRKIRHARRHYTAYWTKWLLDGRCTYETSISKESDKRIQLLMQLEDESFWMAIFSQKNKEANWRDEMEFAVLSGNIQILQALVNIHGATTIIKKMDFTYHVHPRALLWALNQGSEDAKNYKFTEVFILSWGLDRGLNQGFDQFYSWPILDSNKGTISHLENLQLWLQIPTTLLHDTRSDSLNFLGTCIESLQRIPKHKLNKKIHPHEFPLSEMIECMFSLICARFNWDMALLLFLLVDILTGLKSR